MQGMRSIVLLLGAVLMLEPAWAAKKKKKKVKKVRHAPTALIQESAPSPLQVVEPLANRELLPLVPWPQSVEVGRKFKRPQTVNLVAQGQWGPEGAFFQKVWTEAGYKTQGRGWPLRFVRDLSLPDEHYRLRITPKNLVVYARNGSGVFYAAQTLRQILAANPDSLPVLELKDGPSATWRGMHLDVSRHFYPVDSVKRFLDLMAAHKMNRFHWHLTDDQGWRIEIKSWPKLTSVGACRAPRDGILWNDRKPQAPGEAVSCEAPHGGFYTQEQIREIVAYAEARHITVIPEIEFPGHARAAIAAYPELGCTGESLTVATGNLWPVKDLFCPGREVSLEFMRDVIGEVAGLFPGPWLHLGGDEADLQQWAVDSATQALKLKLGLKTDLELEGWYWNQAAEMALKAGKIPVGWDEVAERGALRNALVMAWRSPEMASKALERGHHTILNLTQNTYFDYYQSKEKGEPPAFNAYLPLPQVYGLELKVPGSDTSSGRILGAQGQLWSEYLPSMAQVGYMALPRMSALSEVVWSGSARPGYEHFQSRLLSWVPELRKMGWNVVQHGLTPEIQMDVQKGKLAIRGQKALDVLDLQCRILGADGAVLDTKDCSQEALYVTVPSRVEVQALYRNKHEGRIAQLDLEPHLLTGLKPEWSIAPADKYNPRSGMGLVDGEQGGSQFSDGRWTGFEGDTLVFTWDLGAETKMQNLRVGFLQDRSSWIFAPRSMVWEISKDGQKWKAVQEKTRPEEMLQQTSVHQNWMLSSKKILESRYVRLKVLAQGKCPEGHPGAGMACWTFLDEITLH